MAAIHIEFPKFHKDFEHVTDVTFTNVGTVPVLSFTSKFGEKMHFNFSTMDYFYYHD